LEKSCSRTTGGPTAAIDAQLAVHCRELDFTTFSALRTAGNITLVAAEVVAKAKTTAATTASKANAKTKKPHPSYKEMIVKALATAKGKGLSRQKLLQFLMANFSISLSKMAINTHMKSALRNGVTSGLFTKAQCKIGTGKNAVAFKSEKVKFTEPKKGSDTLKRTAAAGVLRLLLV